MRSDLLPMHEVIAFFIRKQLVLNISIKNFLKKCLPSVPVGRLPPPLEAILTLTDNFILNLKLKLKSTNV